MRKSKCGGKVTADSTFYVSKRTDEDKEEAATASSLIIFILHSVTEGLQRRSMSPLANKDYLEKQLQFVFWRNTRSIREGTICLKAGGACGASWYRLAHSPHGDESRQLSFRRR